MMPRIYGRNNGNREVVGTWAGGELPQQSNAAWRTAFRAAQQCWQSDPPRRGLGRELLDQQFLVQVGRLYS